MAQQQCLAAIRSTVDSNKKDTGTNWRFSTRAGRARWGRANAQVLRLRAWPRPNGYWTAPPCQSRGSIPPSCSRHPRAGSLGATFSRAARPGATKKNFGACALRADSCPSDAFERERAPEMRKSPGDDDAICKHSDIRDRRIGVRERARRRRACAAHQVLLAHADRG